MLEPAVLSDLRGRYAEPHRSCHDWARVAEMLAMAEDLAHAIAERGAFIVAVLFHKSVFDRRLPDWAERSAALMRETLGARERVYLTDRFYLEREKPARRNIERAVASLRGSGTGKSLIPRNIPARFRG